MLKSVLLFIAIVALGSCENSEQEINAMGKKAVQKNQAIRVESFLSQGGVLKARLTAPIMQQVLRQFSVDTPFVEFPKSLHVDFFNAEKKVESRLDARYGKYFESLDKVYLRDSVIVISIKGDTLTCEDLWWDQDKELFYTDRPALLRRPGGRTPAQSGLEATQDFKKITFKTVRNGYQVSEGSVLGGPQAPPSGAAAADTTLPTQTTAPAATPHDSAALQRP